MEHFLKLLAHHGGFSSTQYWHLRLLTSLTLGPLLGILYLVFFDRRKPPRVDAAEPGPTMWVGQDGRLLVRPTRPQARA